MLKIRLMRIGAKGRPFYRIVVVDERKKRTGAYIDLLGTYNPLSTPKEIKFDQAKVDSWLQKGAQMSDGFLRITKQNVHITERKVKNPGKLRSNTPKAEEAPVVEEVAADVAEESADAEVVEETPTTDAPVENVETAEEVTPDAQTEVAAEEPAAEEEAKA